MASPEDGEDLSRHGQLSDLAYETLQQLYPNAVDVTAEVRATVDVGVLKVLSDYCYRVCHDPSRDYDADIAMFGFAGFDAHWKTLPGVHPLNLALIRTQANRSFRLITGGSVEDDR